MEQENGSVLLPVIMIAACIAFYALMVLRAGRSDIVVSAAAVAHTRMDAAAEAALSTAVASMLKDPDLSRWTSGTTREAFDLGSLRVEYAIADVRGRVPINSINAQQAQRLFAKGGAGPSEASIMADELIARRSLGIVGELAVSDRSDDVALPSLAHSTVHSLADLRSLPGMTSEMVVGIAPFVTVVNDKFDPTTAGPEAKSVMDPDVGGGGAISRIAEPDQTRSKIFMRPLEVSVAVFGDGNQLHRTFEIELTGSPLRPFLERGELRGE